MIRSLRCAAFPALFLVVSPAYAQTPSAPRPAAAPRWLGKLNDGQRLAKQEGKPLLVMGFRTTCGNCASMEKRIFPSPAIAEMLSREFVCVKLNIDSPPGEEDKYFRQIGKTTLPQIAYVGTDGKYISGTSGYRDEKALEGDLKGVLQSPSFRLPPDAERKLAKMVETAEKDLTDKKYGSVLRSARQAESGRGWSESRGRMKELAARAETAVREDLRAATDAAGRGSAADAKEAVRRIKTDVKGFPIEREADEALKSVERIAAAAPPQAPAPAAPAKPPVADPPAAPAAQEPAASGDPAVASGDYETALKDGRIYFDRQEWSRSLECFQRALKANPKSAEAQGRMGGALAKLKRWPEAETVLRRALLQEEIEGPTVILVQRELAAGYLQAGQADKAVQTAEDGLKSGPSDDGLLRVLGSAHAAQSRWQEALDAWQKSLAANPNQTDLNALMQEARQKMALARRAQSAGGPTAPAGPVSPYPSFAMPNLGGWAVTEDNVTLILSVTARAELVYVDTVTSAESRRVTLDFKPAALARQGDLLFAAVQGASILHILEADTGKSRKEIKIPGEPIVELACHSGKGPLFVSNTREEISVVDPRSGSVTKTRARGRYLAVDPKTGAFLYTGRTSPNDWDVEVDKDEKGRTTLYFDNWGYRSLVRKYAVSGSSLREVAANDNAAVNGRAMHLSPDGEKIAVAGGGGWRPKRGGTGGGYVIAVFSTKDLTTLLGQVDLGIYTENIAFHPVLGIGAALANDSQLMLFNARSMAEIKRWKIQNAPRGFNEPGMFQFAGRGRTLAYWQPGSRPQNQDGRLYLVPLDVTSDEQTKLEAYFGGTKISGGAVPAAFPAAGAETTEDPAALVREAEAAEKAGDKAKALALYKRAAKADPNSDLGNQASRKVLALDEPKAADPAARAKTLLKSAQSLERNGSIGPALKYYRRLVDECPDSAEAKEARRKIAELDKP